MSTYNTQLQSNNIDLQEVLQALQNKESSSKTIVCVDDASKAIVERTIVKIEDERITHIGNNAFRSCPKLTTANFPVCSYIGINAFEDCSKLTTINFPVCSYIDNNAFDGCNNLTTASFPACTQINNGAFCLCTRLTTVSFPVCTQINRGAFSWGYNLATVSFPMCSYIGNDAFTLCHNLSSLTLGASTVCTLSNSSAFYSTPFTGYSVSFSGTPHIYVPASLVDAYKSATNWVYFSSYITAIEDMEV